MLISMVMIFIFQQTFGNLEEDHNDHTDVQMDKTELAFRLIDSDDDGYIDRDEFAKFSKNLSKGQIDKVWSKLDKDGDGRISISEFYDMMEKKKKKCENEKSVK